MKKLIILAAALLLGACAHAPLPDLGIAPPVKLPELPKTLSEPAHRLPPITDPTLGGVIQDGTATDIKYNDLASKFNALQTFYECIRVGLQTKNPQASVEQCLR